MLWIGSRGVEVTRAQQLINAYFSRNRSTITADMIERTKNAKPKISDVVSAAFRVDDDGDYGERTEAAVYLVQVHAGSMLVDDGKIGPMTWATLEQRTIMPVDIEDPSKNGLLIGGRIVPVPGVKVIGPHDAAWSHLHPGDSQPRRKEGGAYVPVRQFMIHKTIAENTERLIPGKGPAGGARKTADYWGKTDPVIYGGAHMVIGEDGETACLADLLAVEAFHGTSSNRWSVGSETRELYDGGFYEAAGLATVEVALVATRELGIQWQMPKRYTGHPIKRMWAWDGKVDFGHTPGGPNMWGIFGHRDNTERRNKFDPGDWIFDQLEKRGVERFDFDANEDIVVWMDRQRQLNKVGHNLRVTGIPDAATTAALKAEGYVSGIYALGRA